MAGASMTVDLQVDDYAAFTVYAHQQPELRARRWAGHKRFAAIMVVGMLVLMLAQSWKGGSVDWMAMLSTYGLATLVGLAVLGGLVLGYERLLPRLIRLNARKLVRQQPEGLFLGAHRLDFGPEGIDDSTGSASGRVPWEAVSRVDETADYLYVMLGGQQGVVVPKRGQSDATLAAVRQVLREHVARATLAG